MDTALQSFLPSHVNLALPLLKTATLGKRLECEQLLSHHDQIAPGQRGSASALTHFGMSCPQNSAKRSSITLFSLPVISPQACSQRPHHDNRHIVVLQAITLVLGYICDYLIAYPVSR